MVSAHSEFIPVLLKWLESSDMPTIIAQDGAFLAVLKRAGMPVQPDPAVTRTCYPCCGTG